MSQEKKEFLNRVEIYNRFDSEWVLLENPKTDKKNNIKGGTVLWHSKNRDEVYGKAIELKPKHGAILFTGQIPKGSAVNL